MPERKTSDRNDAAAQRSGDQEHANQECNVIDAAADVPDANGEERHEGIGSGIANVGDVPDVGRVGNQRFESEITPVQLRIMNMCGRGIE